MRVGIVFHKSPFGPPTGIDLVRLRTMAFGLLKCGLDVEIIAPVAGESRLDGVIPVFPPSVLRTRGRYDVVKTCYHFSVALIGDYKGPLVSRIVRVVDRHLPQRDECRRDELLHCQDLILRRVDALVLNNKENADRWRHLYGKAPPITLVPTGCPVKIPPVRSSPYGSDKKVMLFLGSLAAPRMARLLNEASYRLQGRCTVHMVGSNKTKLYGGHGHDRLSPQIVPHGELPEEEIWDFIRCAHVGLALAAGPDEFDNDLSKIYSYLRGGLPVLCEERVANLSLALESKLGMVFRYGDTDALVSNAVKLLDYSPIHNRASTMEWMVREHSWDRRVEALRNLLITVASMSGQKPIDYPERDTWAR